MRTTFASALVTLLFAASVVAAPVADVEADRALEKRQHYVTVTVHHPHVAVETHTVHYKHTVTQYVQPPSPAYTPPAPADNSGTSGSSGGSGHKHGQNTPPDTSNTDTSSSDSSYSGSSDSGAPDSDAQTMLDAHNQYRALHSAPPLTWSDTLASFAESHASNCVFEHTSGPYGENLAAGYGSIQASIDAWYNEISDYSFSNPGFSEEAGHFTQLVWVASTELGCAWVACNGQNGTPGSYLMCEYQTAGNVIGDFPNNVLPG